MLSPREGAAPSILMAHVARNCIHAPVATPLTYSNTTHLSLVRFVLLAWAPHVSHKATNGRGGGVSDRQRTGPGCGYRPHWSRRLDPAPGERPVAAHRISPSLPKGESRCRRCAAQASRRLPASASARAWRPAHDRHKGRIGARPRPAVQRRPSQTCRARKASTGATTPVGDGPDGETSRITARTSLIELNDGATHATIALANAPAVEASRIAAEAARPTPPGGHFHTDTPAPSRPRRVGSQGGATNPEAPP